MAKKYKIHLLSKGKHVIHLSDSYPEAIGRYMTFTDVQDRWIEQIQPDGSYQTIVKEGE